MRIITQENKLPTSYFLEQHGFMFNSLQLNNFKAYISRPGSVCVSLTLIICLPLSTELARELSKTKRVRIATEVVVLEDESKPRKKKKKDVGK